MAKFYELWTTQKVLKFNKLNSTNLSMYWIDTGTHKKYINFHILHEYKKLKCLQRGVWVEGRYQALKATPSIRGNVPFLPVGTAKNKCVSVGTAKNKCVSVGTAKNKCVYL